MFQREPDYRLEYHMVLSDARAARYWQLAPSLLFLNTSTTQGHTHIQTSYLSDRDQTDFLFANVLNKSLCKFFLTLCVYMASS